MTSSHQSVRELVQENSTDDFLGASNILITFATNVLENPNDGKYRKIRIANPTVQNKLLNVVGGMECLFEMGFQEIEDGEVLMLPSNASLDVLKSIKDDLNRERERLQRRQTTQASESVNARRTAQAVSQSVASRASQFYLESESAFLGRLRSGMRRVMQYEIPSVKQKARDVIPLDLLQSEAKSRLESGAGGNQKLDIRDYLLLALLKWFKTSFFRWVDTLPCSQCNGATRNSGSLPASSEERKWGSDRVEAHTCDTCGFVNRFPRFTNPEKLLETRRGRCGEWADCFTLCCRALDFEARYVLDWTDHVWTEVYSNSLSRWVHCDPCENICDKPLLYESGWGKKLTYVIGVSKDEIQDVTWRYSAKHKDVLARRKLCRESWLRRTIHKLWHEKLSALPQNRQQELWHRLICELTEFVTIKEEGENLPGRTTGSLAWRQARGELGNTASASSAIQQNFVFRPLESERESEVMHVVYSCAMDKYVRMSSGDEEHQGWQSCTHSHQHVFRKEELDWKMVYLARNDGSSSAEAVWKFDLTDTDLRISKMELKAQTAVYENGTVSWQICAGDNCFTQDGPSLQEFMTFDLRGCQTLSIKAVLQGGKGDVAWQHTQLFRQSSNDKSNFPFEIKLFLN